MNPEPSEDGAAQAMLEAAFANLGATAAQARVMAAQVLKRARQLAVERRITEAEAMRELLAKVVAGRTGAYTGQPPPQASGG